MESERLPLGWRVAPLPDHVYFQEGPGLRNWQYRDVGVPFVNIRCLKDGRLQRNEMNCLDLAEVQGKYTHFLLSAGDYVVSSSGTLGRLAEVKAEDLPCMLNTSVIRFRSSDEEELDRRYLKYFLLSDLFTNQVLSYANGSAQLNYGPTHLKQMMILLPPIGEQRSIGSLLGDIDSRISMLRDTNATLESIAQALFKSWFVDFDPVRSKAEDLTPVGMDADTAALFPSEFEQSELGSIPKGWLTGTFGSIANQSKGSVNPLNFPETVYDHYSLPAFDAGLMPVRELGEAIKSNKTPVPRGAVLISKLNPHIPRIWFTGEVRPNAVCSTEFLVWTPADGVTAEYIYCLATSTPFNTAMKQLVTGTSNSHQRIKPDYLTAISAVVPSPEVTTAFGRLAAPLHRRVLENRSIAQSLAQLRDALLPRLISGKLRLPEAEAVIEEALA